MQHLRQRAPSRQSVMLLAKQSVPAHQSVMPLTQRQVLAHRSVTLRPPPLAHRFVLRLVPQRTPAVRRVPRLAPRPRRDRRVHHRRS